ncbi:hypothetical protein DIPPA_15278 [Diplonema papillatum]|nr:hypothetical protein DIPPA_15278 [Diplonema papillatum]
MEGEAMSLQSAPVLQPVVVPDPLATSQLTCLATTVVFDGLKSTDFSETNIQTYTQLNEVRTKVLGMESELRISMISKFRSLFEDLTAKNDGKRTQAQIKRENKMSLAKSLVNLIPDISMNGLTLKMSSVGEVVEAVSEYLSAKENAANATRERNTSDASRTVISRVNATLESEIARFVKQFVLKFESQLMELTERGRRQLTDGIVTRVDQQLGQKYYAYDKFSDNLWMALFEGSYDTQLDTAKVNGISRKWRLSGLLLHCGIVRVPSARVDVLSDEVLKSMIQTIDYLQCASLRGECLLMFDFYFYAARKGYELEEISQNREAYSISKHQMMAVEHEWASFKIIPAVGFLWRYFNASSCCQREVERALLTDNGVNLTDDVPDYCRECNHKLGRLERTNSLAAMTTSRFGGTCRSRWASTWLKVINANTNKWLDEKKELFFYSIVEMTLSDIILSNTDDEYDPDSPRGVDPHGASARSMNTSTSCDESTVEGYTCPSMGYLMNRRKRDLHACCSMRHLHRFLASLLVLRRKLEVDPEAAVYTPSASGSKDNEPTLCAAAIDEEQAICLDICKQTVEHKATYNYPISSVLNYFKIPKMTPATTFAKESLDAFMTTEADFRRFNSDDCVSEAAENVCPQQPHEELDNNMDGRYNGYPAITQEDWEMGRKVAEQIEEMADRTDKSCLPDFAFTKHLYETMIQLKRIRGPCDDCREQNSSSAKCNEKHSASNRRARQSYMEVNPTARPLDEYCYLTSRVADLDAQIEKEEASLKSRVFCKANNLKALHDKRAYYRLRYTSLKRELNRVTGKQSMRAMRTVFEFLIAYRKASPLGRQCFTALYDITMEVNECMRDQRTDSAVYLAEFAVRKPLSLFVSQLYELNRNLVENPRNLSHNKKKRAFEETMLPGFKRDCFNHNLREQSHFYIKATPIERTTKGVTFNTQESKASEYGFRFCDPYEMNNRINMTNYQYFGYDELEEAAQAEVRKTFTTPPHLRWSSMAFPHQICTWTRNARAKALTSYSRST